MNKEKKLLISGLAVLALFLIFTILVKTVDVQAVGPNGSCVGFSAVNSAFHELTGVNFDVYNLTDQLGAVPFLVCLIFLAIGLFQLIKRRSLLKVDADILVLGVYYATVIFFFFLFEKLIINYRPVLIEGVLEASYPSSTTLLVLTAMPTLVFQTNRRIKNKIAKFFILIFTVVFSAFMVVCRLCCGVHWLTDIVGGVILSTGLLLIYSFANLHWTE